MLEDLPIGAFVFKFVDEVVMNTKLMWQIQDHQKNGESNYHYGMHLDADWAFEMQSHNMQGINLGLWN